VWWRGNAADVDALIALRVEEPAVFDAVHRSVLAWVNAGEVDSLCIDHSNGLRDPAVHLERLRAAAPQAWIVVEKLLARGEKLPPWPAENTTGYDVLVCVGGPFLDRPRGARPHRRRVRRPRLELCRRMRAAELEVLRSWLAADVQRLTGAGCAPSAPATAGCASSRTPNSTTPGAS
jgi:(1->4)-alpha-D-glucan 1-alpha-D-glucosylmutase